jgi:DNA repair protein SbcC/Rad50
MRIKKIVLKNIRSYEDQVIELPQGSVLLSGDIGCGKTSVLLAIEFALFGLQPSQRGSSLLKNGKNEGSVILEFEVEGKSVIIERSLQKSGKNIAQDYSSISVDNEKFEGAVTEIKNRVLQLLNYPMEFAKKTNVLYRFTVYTPQEEMKQIILESPEMRLNTLRNIFGIDKYKRIAENTSIFAARLREEIRNKEGRLEDLDSIKLSLEDKKIKHVGLQDSKQNEEKVLLEKKQEIIRVEEDIKAIEIKVKEKENLEKEKEKAGFMLINKKDSILELTNQMNRLRIDIEEGKKIVFQPEKLKEIAESIAIHKSHERAHQEKIINFSSQLNSLNARRMEAEILKEKISNLKSCPTCLQEVNDSYKENIFKKVDAELSMLRSKLSEIDKSKTEVLQFLESERMEIPTLEQRKSQEEINKVKIEHLKEKEALFEEFQRRKRQNDLDMELINQHIKSLEEDIRGYSKFDEIFQFKQKELSEKKLNERKQEMKVVETNKEISFMQNQIKEIENKIEEMQRLKSQVDYLKNLQDWLSEKFLNMILFTEKNVMLKLREEFSKLFSEWFSVLVPETLSARLDEEFSPIIEQQGFEISYNYLSGGERTSVALAYRLALNQVINSLLSKMLTRDLIILDEPTDGFSETQLDKMRDVLTQLKVEQLILVSHEAKIESFVENIIKFKKNSNNITQVEK